MPRYFHPSVFIWSHIFALAEFIDGYRLVNDPSIAEADLLTYKMIRLAFTCRDRKQDDELEENPEQRILAALHPDQVKLCELLKEGMNVTEIARSLQKPRPTIYGEMKRIREIFHKEGLHDFL